MTDTPLTLPTVPPPSRLEQVKAFVGDLARPFAIIATSYSATHATIVIAYRVDGFSEAALFIAAVYAGVGALYGAKSWENAKAGKQAAEVALAKVTTSASPDGELPQSERIG